MDILSLILLVIGLCLFETISSIDNAVVNANILSTMHAWARKWFLLYGFLTAVLIIRGIFPWLIIWLTNLDIGISNAFIASFNTDEFVRNAILNSSPFLLAMGGTFLNLLFLDWLFMEKLAKRNVGRIFFDAHRAIFTIFSLSLISCVVYFISRMSHYMLSAVLIGSIIFLVAEIFKRSASDAHKSLKSGSTATDVKKILYLEIIDAIFSVDSVLGAFAFTMSVPIIILGNGLGVYLVRYLTINKMNFIKRLPYLKDGTMYSVLFLGIIMMVESQGVVVPSYISPAITIVIVFIAFLASKKSKAFHTAA